MRLDVQTICPDSMVFREDGARLHAAILAAWSDEETLDVDFGGRPVASISFFDEAIASLFVEFDSETIRRRLRVVGLDSNDVSLLNRCVRKRRRAEDQARQTNDVGGTSPR